MVISPAAVPRDLIEQLAPRPGGVFIATNRLEIQASPSGRQRDARTTRPSVVSAIRTSGPDFLLDCRGQRFGARSYLGEVFGHGVWDHRDLDTFGFGTRIAQPFQFRLLRRKPFF